MRYTDKTLSEQMGIHNLEIEARKSYLHFTQEDCKNLMLVKDFIETEVDELVSLFYLHQLKIDEVSLIIGDADTLARLKSYQRQYILDLFSGDYNESYINNRLRIGLVHKRIGVETKHYLSGMAYLKIILTDFIKLAFQDKSEDKLNEIDNSLVKLLNFDVQLVIDTFISSLLTEVEASKNKMKIYANSLEEQVKKRTKELEELSLKDPMTGLFNRRALDEFMERDLANAQRTKADISALYMDMDGFKQINDIQGHQIGDELIKKVADSLMEVARDGDINCRMGGDEFCAILINCNEEQAEIVANRIIDNFKSRHHEECTLSVGIAQFKYDGEDNSDQLILRADAMMYEAKKKKGNAVIRFSKKRMSRKK